MPRPSPRLSLRRKTGVIFALAALVLGGLTASAMGWANEKEKGKGRGHKEKTTPTNTVPQTPTQPVPTTPSSPPAPPAPASPAAPAAPVTPQGGPAETPSPVSGPTRRVTRTPAAKRGQPVLVKGETESSNAPTPSIAPAAEQSRKTLAFTGLSPVLMALLGGIFLAGGALLLRRAFA
jgi:hypothetical protein